MRESQSPSPLLGLAPLTATNRLPTTRGQGNPINSNRFIALMAAITLRDHPGTTIVTDSVTSNGLTDFIASLGGKHFRWGGENQTLEFDFCWWLGVCW
jgi:hypothetical protein